MKWTSSPPPPQKRGEKNKEILYLKFKYMYFKNVHCYLFNKWLQYLCDFKLFLLASYLNKIIEVKMFKQRDSECRSHGLYLTSTSVSFPSNLFNYLSKKYIFYQANI